MSPDLFIISVGSLLAQLSDEQLRDAFRAANYSDGVRESYVSTLRERINQLTELPREPRGQVSTDAGVGTKIRRINSKLFNQAQDKVSGVFTRVRRLY